MSIVVLRRCYKISRAEAGALPRWERELLVNAGKQFLGIGAEPEEQPQGGFSASEVSILTTSGAA